MYWEVSLYMLFQQTSPERHCVEEGGYATYCANGINLSVLYEHYLFKFILR